MTKLKQWLHSQGLYPLAWLLLFFILTAQILRVALLIKTGGAADPSLMSLLKVFIVGFFFDCISAAYFFIPLILFLTLAPRKLLHSVWFQPLLYVGYSLWIFIILFNLASEWIFWDEFGSRYNFIAVDYLIYTQEVIGNLMESYPIGTILSILFLLCLAIVWQFRADLMPAANSHHSLSQRLLPASLFLLIPVLSFFLVNYDYKNVTPNHYLNSLAGNGIYEFFAAAYNNELDYEQHYYSLPVEESFKLVKQQLKTPHRQFISDQPLDLHYKMDYPEPEKKMNLVIISVESLSAEYLGSFGNTQQLTPHLDHLAQHGTLYSNLYATGTRTVRGLEALSLSLPPTPGQSIVKRPHNEEMTTLGQILQDKNYDSRFIYGGYGYFDNMNYYFSHNGYATVDRTIIPKEKIHGQNIWGVADEDLFTQAIEEIDRSHAQNKLSFSMIMTTTNHRPYTYPKEHIDIPSGTSRMGAVKYTDWAIGDFIERAQKKTWFKNTLFVIVADHCASSAGKTELPVDRYHIPMIMYAPNHIKPGVMSRLMSQIDVVPTILGWLKVDYQSQFFGYDIFDLEPGRERVFIGTYQNLGYIRHNHLVELSPNKKTKIHENIFNGPKDQSTNENDLIKEAVSWYQSAAYLFKHQKLKNHKS